jgi:sugar phosphate isomerase/epimerase
MSIQLGIFAKTFVRPTLGGVLDAVKSHGLHCVQFSFACADLPAMPDEIEPSLLASIRQELAAREITIAALSGTFNMIHPDPKKRREGLERLPVLAAACKELGIPVITLCTGTRDPQNMWRHHSDNRSPEAWRDLTHMLSEALQIAQRFDVTLAFEPEVSNVVDSARNGRRLLDEMQSSHLKVVMDGANLFPSGKLSRMQEILDEAFDLLGSDLIIAHAKDLDRDGEAGDRPAGKGLLDYDHYLRLLHRSGFTGPLLLHSLAESEVEECLMFLRAKLVPLTNGL